MILIRFLQFSSVNHVEVVLARAPVFTLGTAKNSIYFRVRPNKSKILISHCVMHAFSMRVCSRLWSSFLLLCVRIARRVLLNCLKSLNVLMAGILITGTSSNTNADAISNCFQLVLIYLKCTLHIYYIFTPRSKANKRNDTGRNTN